MKSLNKLICSTLLTTTMLLIFAGWVRAADPGTPFPASSAVSDQKAGSVLIYNVYVSSAANPNAENTRINITNTATSDANVHFFFVDGESCNVADHYVCLTGNQSMSFNMSDIDPGVMGYIVAVATNSSGVPVLFNNLIGDAYVKFTAGHAANLGAEAIALAGAPPTVNTTLMTADLLFDDVQYNALPRVLAIDYLFSRTGGNSTLVVINRIGGDLRTTTSSIGSLFGLLYDHLENPYSFTYSGGCQRKAILGVDFPKTVPVYSRVIVPGMGGWLKFWATDDADADAPGFQGRALLGAVINYNPNTSTDSSSFNGGHNLHKLTFTTDGRLTIPVFPSNCDFN